MKHQKGTTTTMTITPFNNNRNIHEHVGRMFKTDRKRTCLDFNHPINQLSFLLVLKRGLKTVKPVHMNRP